MIDREEQDRCAMEAALREVLDALATGQPDAAWLDKTLRRHNRLAHDGTRRIAKKRLLPFYLETKAHDPQRWAGWAVDEATEQALIRLLRAKPRRTASGVATITVLTKPWPCSSRCLYCPNDVRMPKSYLTDEPACQRAERNRFDPYLQVMARLRALWAMGHPTDKVELIVLGGTWSDYPEQYQRWFIEQLFCALNDAGSKTEEELRDRIAQREAFYDELGISGDGAVLATAAAPFQRRVNEGELTYAQAIAKLYDTAGQRRAAEEQEATFEAVEKAHRQNEEGHHRVVGLVIETRPDLITVESLTLMRRLGCTKVQMGIQSLDETVLARNKRAIAVERIAEAFCLLRRFGFKIHVHFMVNLLGATAEGDVADYGRLVSEEPFLPDEVKLYPCCLVESAALRKAHDEGAWQPYDEEELVGVLVADTLATPAYMRISRMIRDISAGDIVAGNKKTNLRQIVEQRVEATGAPVREIRHREIATDGIGADELLFDCVVYRPLGSEERFLQWVTPQGRIAGFLRLSLPDEGLVAMIREVHVYGMAARLHEEGEGVQHRGLGRALVERACDQARQAGYHAIDVISAVGTRGYYRKLGFENNGLYQRRQL